MAETKGKPEKINIDHILEGDDDDKAPAGDDVIEIVSDEETPGAGGAAGASAEELEAARKEVEELRDLWMRSRADFENLKKRVERDREEERARMAAGILAEILPSIDNLDRALEQTGDEAAFREGVALIRRQMDDALGKLGVQPIEALGEPFDPVFHEAMSAEPREGFAPNTVIEEIRKGYTLGGRVIRPTLVKVVVAPPAGNADSPGETGDADGQDHRD